MFQSKSFRHLGRHGIGQTSTTGGQIKSSKYYKDDGRTLNMNLVLCGDIITAEHLRLWSIEMQSGDLANLKALFHYAKNAPTDATVQAIW